MDCKPFWKTGPAFRETEATMNAAQTYRPQDLISLPPMAENAMWRAVDPRDRHRIDCDHISTCGEQAIWATQHGRLYLCDYHRFVYEVQRAVEALKVRNPDCDQDLEPDDSVLA
jgi:hypothetical protein